MLFKVLAVFIGGGAGSLLRWVLAVKYNPAIGGTPAFPVGTLVANLIGGFLIGLLMAVFMFKTDWSEEWRLLIVTGLLGGLTTFSAFSWEIIHLLSQGRLSLGVWALFTQVGGSLSLTAIGLALGCLFFKV